MHAAWRWRRESSAGRVVTWSATLGFVQAALLVAGASGNVDVPRAVTVLGVAFALAAGLVVGTTWLLRLALPGDRESAPIAGLVAFYDEKVDVFVDGERQARPRTHFS